MIAIDPSRYSLRMAVAVRFGQLLRHAKRHAARDDRDLVHRIAFRHLHADQRVAGFVDTPSVRFSSSDMTIERRSAPIRTLSLANSKSVHRDDLVVVAGGIERRFVDEVREVGTGESGCSASDHR